MPSEIISRPAVDAEWCRGLVCQIVCSLAECETGEEEQAIIEKYTAELTTAIGGKMGMHTKKPLDAARDSADLHARAAVNFSAFTPEEVARMAHYDCQETQCVNALAGIADPAAFVEKVRKLVFYYHVFGLIPSPDFHKLFRELAKLLPPKTP